MEKFVAITNEYKNTLKEKKLAELDKSSDFKLSEKDDLKLDDEDEGGVRDISQEIINFAENFINPTDYSKPWIQLFLESEEARWFDNREYFSEEEEEEDGYESDYDSEEEEYYAYIKNSDDED